MSARKPVVAVIGSGFSGLAAASVLAQEGCEVHVFEKNAETGGRARSFTSNGFTFDMGPSWYWMPDVFERFYERMGQTAADFYELKKLDPGFSVIFGKDNAIDIPANFDELCALFERHEVGAAQKLVKFMKDSEYKYMVGMKDLVYQPGLSIMELLKPELITDVFKLQLFSSFRKHVRHYFKNPQLVAILEFPVLFLGSTPQNTPALYSLMNYAGLKMGTFYPMGGFGKVAGAFKTIAYMKGVKIHTKCAVRKLEVINGKVAYLHTQDKKIAVDAVIGAADYHHIETRMLEEKYRTYTESYWESRTFAPSCLIFYLGINKKLDKLQHHNLFFDADIELHTSEIYGFKQWPSDPLFYVCCPSKTDPSVAPEGSENLFILMPVATDLQDPEETRERYFNIILKRIENYLGEEIGSSVVFSHSYSVSDFMNDYNAYQGNAYGLANTLMQTAILKPKLQSKKLSNLFFSGQLTVPGPGVPPAIISGQVAAGELIKVLKHEGTL